MISAESHIMLRQAAMAWALATTNKGESPEAVVARAETYLAFVLLPARDEVQTAMAERARATIQ